MGSIKTVMTWEQVKVVSELYPDPSSPAPGCSGHARGRCSASGCAEPRGQPCVASGTMLAL